MRIAIIGRTKMLLDTARILSDMGHQIVLVITSKESSFYEANISDFEKLATESGAIFIKTSKANNFVQQVSALSCDVAISMNCTSILSREFLECFRLGVFNAHPGDLPRFKGNACPNWAIIHGESRITITIHKMNERLDDGPIAFKSHFSLNGGRDVEDFYTWLSAEVPSLFGVLIKSIENDCLKLVEQQHTDLGAIRCFPRAPEDSLINWCQSSEGVLRMIRASTRPFSGAFTYWKGKKFRIWKAEIFYVEEECLAVPGQLMFLDDGSPIIAASVGALKLLELSSDDDPVDVLDFCKNLRNRFSSSP